MHISSTKTSHIALVVAFTLYFVTLYLAFTNPIQPPKPENHTYIKGPVTITGYLTHQPFPGRQYTSAEAAHGEPIFAESLYLAVAKNQTEAASQRDSS